MAVSRINATSKLALKVVTDTDASGNHTYKNRTISNLNTALSDDDAREVGVKIAALQDHNLDSVTRTDSARLAAA